MTRTIEHFMHAGVESHAPGEPITSLAKTMKDKDVGAVPIIDQGRLVGMVTDRDIAVRALAGGADPAKLTAKDVMTKEVACCKASDSLEAASGLMQRRGVRRLPVLGKGDKVVGMVSLGDITHALSEQASGRLVRAVSAHHA